MWQQCRIPWLLFQCRISSVSIGFWGRGLGSCFLQMPQLLLWHGARLVCLFDVGVGVAARAGDKWLCTEDMGSRSLSFLCRSAVNMEKNACSKRGRSGRGRHSSKPNVSASCASCFCYLLGWMKLWAELCVATSQPISCAQASLF